MNLNHGLSHKTCNLSDHWCFLSALLSLRPREEVVISEVPRQCRCITCERSPCSFPIVPGLSYTSYSTTIVTTIERMVPLLLGDCLVKTFNKFVQK